MTDTERPDYWPAEVEPITWDDTGKLGVNQKTHQLYWDGEPLVTERRFSTQERVLAWFGVSLAALGVIATVVQAWFAAFPRCL
jgi:hypothetical protein